MGIEIAALLGFFGITSAFALVGAVLGGWMAWRIVEKAGFPGWMGLGAILLTLTAVASVVPLILLWVFAYMRWPRDDRAALVGPMASGALPPPPQALADRRIWRLNGRVAEGSVSVAFDGGLPSYLLTGAPAAGAGELSVPDSSVDRPHARLLCAAGRLGLEDLGSTGGTFVDGARLLPEHGPRDITSARAIRLGSVELILSRA